MARVDRRALFTSGAAAALLAASGLALQAAPRRGGRLRLAVAPESGALDRLAQASIFETLTVVGPDGVLSPGLATSWQAGADLCQWAFSIRAGVFGHDGQPCTAGDIVRCLDRSDELAQVSLSGTDQVEIVLASPDAGLPFRLADQAFSIALAPDESGTPVGTGLYTPQDYRPGRYFLGRRAQPHHRDGEAGWADAIEIIAISDPKMRAEALRDGFVDIAETPDRVDLRDATTFHPTAQTGARLLAHADVGVPLYGRGIDPASDQRLAERWWIA